MSKVRMEEYFDRLWPINRSILNPGFRKSLDILKEVVPFENLEFKTGEQIYDWTIPNEWDVNEAYIISPNGKKLCDFSENNLHLVSHSMPFEGVMPLNELKSHLHSFPDQPDAVPYITTFFDERWGFCISDNQLKALPEGEYKVKVDTKLYPGKLVVGEAVLPGESEQEIFFSSYLCHPSMANNELSGPLAVSFLYEKISQLPKRHFTYRFALMPETIGSLCYLSRRADHLKKNLLAGYVLTCVALGDNINYKLSKSENSSADRKMLKVLEGKRNVKILPYTPIEGSDERQYGSPGFNLPIGSFMRRQYLKYPEYHTSFDNKDLISFDTLEESVNICFEVVQEFESSTFWKNTVMYGEPRLGKRGLYPTFTNNQYFNDELNAILWILNLADGSHDLHDIAVRSEFDVNYINEIAEKLADKGLLTR